MTPGQAQSEQGDPPDGLPGGDRLLVAEGRAGAGVEEVERDLGGIELLELGEQLHPLLVALTHPDEGTAAQLHAVVPHQAAGLLALLPACGR